MVHNTYTENVEGKVCANRLWYALIKDSENFLPKSGPEKIASVEFHEGQGVAVGAVRTIKFHKGVYAFPHVKQKFEEVDDANRFVKFSVLEGGLASAFGNVKMSLHFKDGADPGTAVVKSNVEYEDTVGEAKDISEEHKMGLTAVIKDAEAYLLQHDDYKDPSSQGSAY